jgi:hypothetical protein
MANIAIDMTIAEKRYWESRARRNRRTLKDEVAFVLMLSAESGWPDTAHTPRAATSPRAAPRHAVDVNEPIEPWMINPRNRSGYHGVHQNGARWRAGVVDPRTGHSIFLEGFKTPHEAAVARQNHFRTHGLVPPRAGRPAASKPAGETRADRVAQAKAAGFSDELAEQAADDLSAILSGRASTTKSGRSDH